MEKFCKGLPPVFDVNSVVLFLGSFPSVKSREAQFYYGNVRNRFWELFERAFDVKLTTVQEKIAFLKSRRIALWDVVGSCFVDGSKDDSIRGEEINDVPSLVRQTCVKRIFCNGKKSFALFEKHFGDANLPQATLLPSTSMANVSFSQEKWFVAFAEIRSLLDEDCQNDVCVLQ